MNKGNPKGFACSRCLPYIRTVHYETTDIKKVRGQSVNKRNLNCLRVTSAFHIRIVHYERPGMKKVRGQSVNKKKSQCVACYFYINHLHLPLIK